MNGIIKSGMLGERSGVRPLGATAAVVLTPYDEELNRLRQRIAFLETELRQRDTTIDRLNGDVKRASEDGVEHGRAAGLAEAKDLQLERLQLLEEGLAKAQAGLSENLSSLEGLACVLARECLDIMLGRSEDRASVLEAIIGAQVAKVGKAMLLRIDVSSEDFPDESLIDAIGKRMGLPDAILTARDDLDSGACQMVLRLGQMEIGIDRQWGTLREILDDMSVSGDAV
jgi:flagellar biosynthesis/type III secretory pathway protein FliH